MALAMNCVKLTSLVTAGTRCIARMPQSAPKFNVRVQQYASKPKVTFVRRARPAPGIKEQVMAPAGETAFNIGKGALAGVSAIGIGSLCFYGLGLSNDVGAIDKAVLWPDTVKKRIRTTYAYFAASIGVTAGTAVAAFRTPAIMRVVARGGWLPMIGAVVVTMGTGMACRAIPYQEGTFGAKQLTWLLHSACVGAIVAPVCLLGGPIVIRAAAYTAGVIGGLSTIAVCAPSEKFLNMGGPLAMGFGAVLVASLGSAFLPPTTVLGAGLYSISLYGGLILFSGFLLYDTQKIVKRAETHPVYSPLAFDPVSNSMSIYMDTINIFIRIATIMAGGGGRRK